MIWEQIEEIKFLMHTTGEVSNLLLVDGLHFYGARHSASALDAGSRAAYGERELVYVDDQLTDANQCLKRANTLIYQLKDPVIRLDVVAPGNTNLKIGDRLTMTIPAEGLEDTEFDIVSVEHTLSPSGFHTECVMVNSANTRSPPPTSVKEMLNRKFHTLSAIAKGVNIIK